MADPQAAAPTTDEVSIAKPPSYAVKLKRESRGTRRMMYLWTGEAPVEGRGYGVIGSGEQGTFRLRAGIAKNLPAVMNVRLYGLNANGKLYFLDRIYRLVP